jgi:hypothetical protein
MGDYLSASDLADLVGCKPNQRVKMTGWLDANRWHYVPDSHGLPKVLRAYRDRKMGISEGKAQSKYAETPNLQVFAQRALARG